MPMRDLEIWRRLTAGAATRDDLAAIAELTLAARAPMLAWIAPCAGDRDPELRAAAVRALAGVRGVAGVRALALGLDDDDPAVRANAVAALAQTAQGAPMRAAHALFHPRTDVRRAALAIEIQRRSSELAAYLRADPACAELAARAPWPARPLELAFDLHAQGAFAAAELVDLIGVTPIAEVRRFVAAGPARPTELVDRFLDDAPHLAAIPPPPGRDVLDVWIAALDATGAPDRSLDVLVEVVNGKRHGALLRRAAVALLARSSSRALIGACAALEPTLFGYASFAPALAGAAAAGVVRFGWPVKPQHEQVVQMLALPIARRELAVAVAIAGLLQNDRAAAVVEAMGEGAVIASLVASDRGWDELCRLIDERSPITLAYWLARVDPIAPARVVALAARALAILTPARIPAISVPERHLRAVFAAFASDDPARIEAVCNAFAAKVDRGAAALMLADAARARPPLAVALARALHVDLLAGAARALDDAGALALTAAIDAAGGLPWDRERALAQAWSGRAALASWHAATARTVVPPPPAPIPSPAARALTAAEIDRIARCARSELEDALRPALQASVTGLCNALAARATAPSLHACAALLGCADPLTDVALHLDRFADLRDPHFHDHLDFAATTMWQRAPQPAPLARARLWRWEAHQLGLIQWIEAQGGVLGALALVEALPGVVAVTTLWRGIAECVMFVRYRDRARYAAWATDTLASHVADQIDRTFGHAAARLLVALVEGGGVHAAAWRSRALDRLADCDGATRDELARILRVEGLPEPPPARVTTDRADEVIAAIRASTDLEALASWCGDGHPTIAQEAVLRLLLLGEPGQLRLAALLPLAGSAVIASVSLWDCHAAFERAREMIDALPAPAQFHLALALAARGERAQLSRAFAAAHEARGERWFGRDEWERCAKVAGPLASAIALADAPHHHAYQPSIAILVDADDEAAIAPMIAFVELGVMRPLHLRRDAARRLAVRWRELAGLPIVLGELIAEGDAKLCAALPGDARATIVDAIAGAALVGGPEACAEKRMIALADALGADPAVAALHPRALDLASDSATRAWAASRAISPGLTDVRLRAIAERFAWGVRRGVELTGRMFRVHMTAKERDLGHTFLDSSRVFVSPLPMLRGEPNGEDVVEGLILHELGHHVYHRGEEGDRIWKKARAEGLGALLNLVADEHLERNLRGVDPDYGDRLKRLASYAFLHSAQEIKLQVLLHALRSHAARALAGTPLEVAFDEASVRIRRGAVLGELDRMGHPLARFTRALRLGQGNRHGDPLVAEALALCKGIRGLDMPGLYALTRKLAELFGGAAAVATVFGGPEGMSDSDRDREVFGAGLDDGELQREVERILDPRQARGTGKLGPRDRLALNVAPDEHFDKIARVERVRGDGAEHRKLAHEVSRHAVRLRALLDDLGLRWEPARARLSGRAIDRTRLKPLVTRSDPRILQARTPVRRTDLFLGTLIDCSGSMQAAGNIDRARRFAALIAEAVRPLRGVDARFFGFTDSVIYDAGDASDCGVTALVADGGNNDAAALHHVASLAASSPKRARVLVMISDGLPTQCSVAALKGLVRTLTRRKGMVCAQVAVRPLEEVCFPHYLVLDDALPDVAVAKFGRMIGDLARRVLSS
jgi:hypothetical protein